MKRVKLMLSAILVVAVVAGALAFKVKGDDVCAYSIELEPDCPATTICPLRGELPRSVNNISDPCKYAFTQTIPSTGCPEQKANCAQSLTLQVIQ